MTFSHAAFAFKVRQIWGIRKAAVLVHSQIFNLETLKKKKNNNIVAWNKETVPFQSLMWSAALCCATEMLYKLSTGAAGL